MRLIASFAAASALMISGCGKSYDEFEPGEFQGRLIVEWYDKDIFVFRPDPEDPLVFTRYNDEAFQPATFQTDGGSTPQILRAFKHYSPWGYAKAYIIHDWIFSEHYCGRMQDVSFHESADILSEGVKTMIETRGEDDPSERKVLETIDLGVRTTFARDAWDNGACNPVSPTGVETFDLGTRKAVFVVE